MTLVYLASGMGLSSWDSLCNDFSDVSVTHCETGRNAFYLCTNEKKGRAIDKVSDRQAQNYKVAVLSDLLF